MAAVTNRRPGRAENISHSTKDRRRITFMHTKQCERRTCSEAAQRKKRGDEQELRYFKAREHDPRRTCRSNSLRVVGTERCIGLPRPAAATRNAFRIYPVNSTEKSKACHASTTPLLDWRPHRMSNEVTPYTTIKFQLSLWRRWLARPKLINPNLLLLSSASRHVPPKV